MSAAAYAGWTAALCAAVGASWLWLRLARHAELVADAGHELRGPLCAARLGCTGSTMTSAPRRSTPSCGARRSRWRTWSRRGAGGERAHGAELVDVGALLDDAAEAWRPLAAAFGAALIVEPMRGRALVRADPVRLAQACGNLVANAVEHGGGPVRVRGRVVAGRVRVEVRDAGPGLRGAGQRAGARGAAVARRGGEASRSQLASPSRNGGRLASGTEPPRSLPRPRAPERGRRAVAGAVADLAAGAAAAVRP